MVSAIWEAEVAELKVDQPGLHSDFKVSLGNVVRPCLKIKIRKRDLEMQLRGIIGLEEV